MKHFVFILTILTFLLSCNSPKRETNKKNVIKADSIIRKETIYSKDSSFYKVTELQTGDASDAPYTTYTIYMHKGHKYYEVHEKAGGDILFIYTDSTKSRYPYDKKGKYFLNRNERAKYLHLLSGR